MTHSRKTRAQRAVLTALKDVGSATPMELFDRINSIGSARHIGLTSVYRALNTLVENGELKRERLNETTARYGFNNDTTAHSHHLVCVKCNDTQPLAECPFDSKELLIKQRFTPLYHNFQIFGLCCSCEPARAAVEA